MSSNFIWQLRKYSGDPLATRFNDLSQQLAQFDAHNVQVEDTGLTNSIRTDNSIDQYSETAFTNVISTGTKFYVPFEPDLNTLKLWFNFEGFGTLIRDISYNPSGLHGVIVGGDGPIGVIGPSKGMSGVEGSIAMAFDGVSEQLQVIDDPSIQMAGQVVGFSVAVLVNIQSFTRTVTGQNRYIASKVDDANNMWSLWIDSDIYVVPPAVSGFTNGFTSGFQGVFRPGFAGYPLHFQIYKNGVSYSISTVTINLLNQNAGLISQQFDSWHWIVATFDAVANQSMLYVDGIAATTIAETPIEQAGALGGFAHAPTSLFIGSNSASDGFFDGGFADFRIYREKVLNQFDVYNLNNNMMSISNIPFGQIAITGLCVAST